VKAAMTIENIAVGVDLSNDARVAAEWGTSIGLHIGAPVTLINVVESSDGLRLIASSEQVASTIKEERATAEERLKILAEKTPGAQVSSMLVDGSPAETLVKTANELGANLIIVGTHGRSGLSRFLLGSVAEEVAERATVSVLVARGRVARDKILAAVSLRRTSEEVVSAAATLVDPGSTLELFHAWNLPVGIEQLYRRVDQSTRSHLAASIEGRLSRSAEALDGRELNVVTNHANRAARAGILARLEEEPFDLVVVGGRKNGVGSTARALLRHSPCSVLIVR